MRYRMAYLLPRPCIGLPLVNLAELVNLAKPPSLRIPAQLLLPYLRDGVALIPSPLAQRWPIGCYIDIQHHCLAVPHAFQRSLQCRSQLARAFHLFAFQAVSFRDFREFDVRVSYVAIEIFTEIVKETAVEHVAVPA